MVLAPPVGVVNLAPPVGVANLAVTIAKNEGSGNHKHRPRLPSALADPCVTSVYSQVGVGGLPDGGPEGLDDADRGAQHVQGPGHTHRRGAHQDHLPSGPQP